MLSGAYSTVKIIHASCALLTLLLFIWRGRLSLQGERISHRWLRILPDSVDTLLLATGVALIYLTGQYPFTMSWISIKLMAVLLYILLGMLALRFAKTIRVRRAAWLAALGVFAAIVWLAHTRQVPFLNP